MAQQGLISYRPLEWPSAETLRQMATDVKSRSLAELLKTDPTFYDNRCNSTPDTMWDTKKEDCDALKTFNDAAIAEIKSRLQTVSTKDRDTLVGYVVFPQIARDNSNIGRGAAPIRTNNSERYAYGPLQSAVYHALAKIDGFESLEAAIDSWEKRGLAVQTVKQMADFLKQGGIVYYRAADPGALAWTMENHTGELINNETDERTLQRWQALAKQYNLGLMEAMARERIAALKENAQKTQQATQDTVFQQQQQQQKEEKQQQKGEENIFQSSPWLIVLLVAIGALLITAIVLAIVYVTRKSRKTTSVTAQQQQQQQQQQQYVL